MEDVEEFDASKITKHTISQYRDILMECHNDSKNQHKYYYIHQMGEDSPQFNIEYGRVGHNPNKLVYPVSQLFVKYNEKIRKGYKVLRIARWDERGTTFTDFLDKFLNGGDDCWLPE